MPVTTKNTDRSKQCREARMRRRISRRKAHESDSCSKSLELKTDDSVQLVQLVQQGFDVEKLAVFQAASGLSMDRIARITDIPKRTLTRRQKEGRLRPHESDRLLRVSRIFDLAVELFECDVEAARQWLEAAQPGLGGAVPLEFSSTDVGAREVEKLIARLEHGVFT